MALPPTSTLWTDRTAGWSTARRSRSRTGGAGRRTLGARAPPRTCRQPPDVNPVAPEDAPPHVAAVYDRLTAAVEAQLEAGLPDATVTRRLRSACVAALDADDAPGGPEGVADTDREAVSERLAAYHENLATLLVTLYIGTRLVE